jgi:hypothetical protein
MPLFMVHPLTGRYLSFVEREEIAVLKGQGLGVREIARRVGRDPSTISRELRRNAATRGGRLDYRGSVAQWKAELLAQRPKTANLPGIGLRQALLGDPGVAHSGSSSSRDRLVVGHELVHCPEQITGRVHQFRRLGTEPQTKSQAVHLCRLRQTCSTLSSVATAHFPAGLYRRNGTCQDR